MDVSAPTTLGSESMEVVWKDTPIDPLENVTKISQFLGAYATATIDKAAEVQLLLKEKERVQLLEQQLEQERQSTNRKV